jgi:hypothetical protein
MSFFRLLVLGLLIYFFYRFMKGKKKSESPKVKRGRPKPEVNPFEGADIQDVPYKEISPTEDQEEEKK